MSNSKFSIVVPVLIIALGVAWLLNTIDVLPGVDWIWTGGLGIAGILVIAAGGVNKLTFVVGPLLVIGSIFSVLRQTGRLSLDIEVPLLVILGGVLMLLANLLGLKSPKYPQQDESEQMK